jgi:hypothetical protein
MQKVAWSKGMGVIYIVTYRTNISTFKNMFHYILLFFTNISVTLVTIIRMSYKNNAISIKILVQKI